MTFTPGTRLGPYEVLSPLGAGGMGEVYRARDTRLGREIALKVLPEEVAADSSRLHRFEKEARSASALNHPNIVTVYEIGSERAISYIAMELVAGKTLRELLFSGPLPIKRLLQIAAQIADGLARAHEAGIVHRDLKPENVMVTKDGLVKILDFGLAKLTRTGSDSDEASQLATETGTTPGTVMGTVGYMSPEQASARPVDFRSDQFSFGSILYEMATGGARAIWKAPPLQPSFHRLTYRRGLVDSARFSPDGRTVLYSARWDGDPPRIFETRPESPESRRLDLSDARLMSVSARGELAIVTGGSLLGWAFTGGTLATVPLAGGAPREIAENVRFADWVPGGKQMLVARDDRLEFPVGKVIHRGGVGTPRVSPAGDRVAFVEARRVHVTDLSGAEQAASHAFGDLYTLAWSPTGEEVWFATGEAGSSSLRAISVTGKERTCCGCPSGCI